MLKFGTIKQYDSTTGLVKVNFEADNIVTDFIPVLFRKTLNEKEFLPFDENEHVACVMDENCEHGVCLGAIYSSADKPASAITANKFGIKFANGDYWFYDRSSNNIKIRTGNDILAMGGGAFGYSGGTTQFTVNGTTGVFTINNGTESLKAVLNDLISAIESITVTATAASVAGPTPVPINNLASFPPIIARINAFLD